MSPAYDSAVRSGGRRLAPLLIASGLLLVVAVGISVGPRLFSDDTRRITQPLAVLVPSDLAGWDVRTLDVADSAEMRASVEKILRYDDVVYRSYRRGATEVQVYVAYWKPGSVPYGQAGVHTPDTCWVNAGWTMDQKMVAREFAFEGRPLKPVEWRRFSYQGKPTYVLFWHLVGEWVHTYDQEGWRGGVLGVFDRLPNYFRDVRRYGFNLEQEQLFLRVSANVDFESLQQDPGFGALMRQLEPLGIFRSDILHGTESK